MGIRPLILRIWGFTLLLLTSAGCNLGVTSVSPQLTPARNQIESPTPFQPIQNNIFVSQSIPESWRQSVENIVDARISTNDTEGLLSLSPEVPAATDTVYGVFTRVYAAVVPFPTITDEISLKLLQSIWLGNLQGEEEFKELLVSKDTAALLTDWWGSTSSPMVVVLDPDLLLTEAWESTSSVALIPFENLDPKWKVLKLDGISPLDKPMNIESYPLAQRFHLVGPSALDEQQAILVERIMAEIPATNRDEALMTVLVMSGTTALTRTVAAKMDLKGVDYPVQDIKEWFLSADLRHVSNEVSVNPECPPPDPQTTSLIFCSEEKYLPVLESIGVNVIELTGNHLNDYGRDAFAETLAIYNERGWDYFGGGINLLEAQKPLKITSNKNKIAFIGCNIAGPPSDFATENSPGSAPCDLDTYYSTITGLKSEGYTVVATFQYHEVYAYMYDEAIKKDFLDAAAAGADIIQGSQAHFPMGFEFSGDALIHYGLGNFLFDQMDTPVAGTKREFIDRHIIYDGRYINTELLTAMLTDWSRPVPMTTEQRIQLLSDIFQASQMR